MKQMVLSLFDENNDEARFCKLEYRIKDVYFFDEVNQELFKTDINIKGGIRVKKDKKEFLVMFFDEYWEDVISFEDLDGAKSFIKDRVEWFNFLKEFEICEFMDRYLLDIHTLKKVMIIDGKKVFI